MKLFCMVATPHHPMGQRNTFWGKPQINKTPASSSLKLGGAIGLPINDQTLKESLVSCRPVPSMASQRSNLKGAIGLPRGTWSLDEMQRTLRITLSPVAHPMLRMDIHISIGNVADRHHLIIHLLTQ